jgi:hypothetical protein
MEPQHRMFLELAWQALTDSGHDPATPPGPVGVFASASANQYQSLRVAAGRAPAPFQSADHLPGPVSFRLGLTGPAVGVQTACSGSLVAVCLAAQSLLDFRCDVAIAGGTNVDLPEYLGLSQREVRAPLALARMRNPSLGHTHGGRLLLVVVGRGGQPESTGVPREREGYRVSSSPSTRNALSAASTFAPLSSCTRCRIFRLSSTAARSTTKQGEGTREGSKRLKYWRFFMTGPNYSSMPLG